tara:strand:+ start:1179 stop:2663 length:1485 start_codon:yes stop_codon:yes gene_type:complete
MNNVRKSIQKKLSILGRDIKNTHISEFQNSTDFKNKVIDLDFLTFDYSRQRINQKTFDYLTQIPDLINLKESLHLLFTGKVINRSENRAVTHTIYRNKTPDDNFEVIFSEREKIKSFLGQNKSGYFFKNLICLSIGGSRLGPELLNEFMSLDNQVNIYFCSSYDLEEIKVILRKCQQSETIVFASSKSFETSEILKNLEHVKTWFSDKPEINFEDHLYGISANASAMTNFGIKEANQFLLLESLGGRFSIWSSISLPAFVNTDYESYQDLLDGANLADEHTSDTPWNLNIPVLMALLSIWNRNALDISNHGIFTYNFRLRSLTKYIAQLSMESNGKSINFDSDISPFLTTPLIWGGYGIENQHSTFQWLMQGKTHASCDFIGINNIEADSGDSYQMLLSQVLALTNGKEDKTYPFKSVRGNNPCSIFQVENLDLKSLGFLLAIYEHKVFIEALILGIDPFDQWGVQLGKSLSLNAKKDREFFKPFFSSSVLPKS